MNVHLQKFSKTFAFQSSRQVRPKGVTAARENRASRFSHRLVPVGPRAQIKANPAQTPKKTPGCFIINAVPNRSPLQKMGRSKANFKPRSRHQNPPRAARTTKWVAWAAKPTTAGLMDMSAHKARAN